MGLGLAGEVGLASAEGNEPPPPRIVLVQSSGVGVERKTEILSSNGGGFRTIPSSGDLPPPAPPWPAWAARSTAWPGCPAPATPYASSSHPATHRRTPAGRPTARPYRSPSAERPSDDAGPLVGAASLSGPVYALTLTLSQRER